MNFRRRTIIVPLAAVLILCGLYISYLKLYGNFHAITPGEAYRSAQLYKGLNLEHYIRKYRIRSILNLRGAHAGDGWYDGEIEVSARYGVAHYDLALSASRQMTAGELRDMLEIFRTAPRPILIHCYSGADRSGLASAIWKLYVDGRTKEEASKQLSVFYGHIPLAGKQNMDLYFEHLR